MWHVKAETLMSLQRTIFAVYRGTSTISSATELLIHTVLYGQYCVFKKYNSTESKRVQWCMFYLFCLCI